jgi:hypothetical protein
MVMSCLLAFFGTVVFLVGFARHDETLKTAGLFLIAPFAVFTAIAAVLFIPLVVYASWKRKRKDLR